jgi:hypothetical protein
MYFEENEVLWRLASADCSLPLNIKYILTHFPCSSHHRYAASQLNKTLQAAHRSYKKKQVCTIKQASSPCEAPGQHSLFSTLGLYRNKIPDILCLPRMVSIVIRYSEWKSKIAFGEWLRVQGFDTLFCIKRSEQERRQELTFWRCFQHNCLAYIYLST